MNPVTSVHVGQGLGVCEADVDTSKNFDGKQSGMRIASTKDRKLSTGPASGAQAF